MILWTEDVFNPNVVRETYDKRTACRRGHAFTEQNTYYGTVTKSGKKYPHRVCRRCKALQDAKYRQRQVNHDRSPIERTPCR